MAEGSPALKMLRDSGLKFDPAADVLSAVGGSKHRVVIFEAAPAALDGNLDKVRVFMKKRGWLMACDLTRDGLASFNKLVGHWISSKPVGLKSAALAWSARFPGDKSEDEAAVYQFAWSNPRANVEISSIDMAYRHGLWQGRRQLRHTGPLGRAGRNGRHDPGELLAGVDFSAGAR